MEKVTFLQKLYNVSCKNQYKPNNSNFRRPKLHKNHVEIRNALSFQWILGKICKIFFYQITRRTLSKCKFYILNMITFTKIWDILLLMRNIIPHLHFSPLCSILPRPPTMVSQPSSLSSTAPPPPPPSRLPRPPVAVVVVVVAVVDGVPG